MYLVICFAAEKLAKAEDKPPLERYVAIMVEGAEHYGVSREYIGNLQMRQRRPRRTDRQTDRQPGGQAGRQAGR